MSEQAILRRLKTVDRLRELCLALTKAKFLTKEEAEELRAKRGAERAQKKLSNSQPD